MSSSTEVTPRSPRDPRLSALVTVRWGDATVAAKHLEGDAEALVGAAVSTIAPIPCEPVGVAAVVVARVREGAAVAFVPRGAVGFRERPRAIPSPVAGPSEITLAVSETVSFSIGDFLITVTAEEASRAPWAALPPLGTSFASLRYFAAAAAAHALLMGLSAQAAHASSLVEEAPDHAEMARYLAAAEERSRAQEEVVSDFGDDSTGRDVNKHDGNGKDGGGARAAGPEGAMGATASRAKAAGRYAITGEKQGKPEDSESTRRESEGGRVSRGPEPFTREEILADARSFGMVGVLAANRPARPVSGFARAAAEGPDPFDADGAMWATAIGETAGAGGLGLTGIGEGGGGDGRGIGLGAVGTFGHTFGDIGFGTGGGGSLAVGFLRGGSWGGSWRHGWLGGIGRIGTIGHVVSGPPIDYNLNSMRRPTSEEQGEQRLPPDAIRRIVRQSHGLFRACYQKALQNNPTLSGTITTRFLIGARGAVASAQNLSHSLPDGQVVTCVTGMFRTLTFPEPPDGRPVTVTYPLTFTPES